MPLSYEEKQRRDARHRHNAFYGDVERMRIAASAMERVRTTTPRTKALAREVAKLAVELKEALRERIDN